MLTTWPGRRQPRSTGTKHEHKTGATPKPSRASTVEAQSYAGTPEQHIAMLGGVMWDRPLFEGPEAPPTPSI